MSDLRKYVATEVPVGWRNVPFWSLFKRVKTTGHENEELLSVYRDHGVVPTASRSDNFNKPSEDLSTYQLVKKGWLVTNKMKAWQGSIAISRFRGIVSPAYYVYRPLRSECDQFLHYLLRSEPYIALYGRISKGIRVNQWDLEHEALRTIPVMLPDLDAQRSIAAFLDRETARIDQLIETKKRQVDVLAEKRRALVTHFVFGQHLDVRFRSHDVSWMPALPEGWLIERLARSFKNLDRHRVPLNSEERADLEKVYPYYGASGIIDYVDRFIFDEDLILVGEDGANLIAQSTPIAFIARGKYWVNNHAHIVKPRNGPLEFWVHMLNQVPYEIFVTGSAQPKLTAQALGSIPLPIPPVSLQVQIAQEIERRSAPIADVEVPIQTSVDRLYELRSALITAAVTGQVDVAIWNKRGETDRRVESIEATLG